MSESFTIKSFTEADLAELESDNRGRGWRGEQVIQLIVVFRAERARCIRLLEEASFHGDLEDERADDIRELIAEIRSGA